MGTGAWRTCGTALSCWTAVEKDPRRGCGRPWGPTAEPPSRHQASALIRPRIAQNGASMRTTHPDARPAIPPGRRRAIAEGPARQMRSWSALAAADGDAPPSAKLTLPMAGLRIFVRPGWVIRRSGGTQLLNSGSVPAPGQSPAWLLRHAKHLSSIITAMAGVLVRPGSSSVASIGPLRYRWVGRWCAAYFANKGPPPDHARSPN